jgi:hypothetical protein
LTIIAKICKYKVVIKKLALLVCSFVITPLALVACILYYSYLTHHLNNDKYTKNTYSSQVAFAALPGTENVTEDTVFQKDSRVEILRAFLQKYSSVLEPYAGDIVAAADKYGLDFRLVPAIGMQESNLCKKAPKDSYNCWGFGIYGGKVTKFEDYPEAIDMVSKTLAKEYKGNGLNTTEEIMARYTPSNKGDWAKSVNFFMEQLQ